MTADKKIYMCECGYTTHFEKALEAHCRFRKHKPLAEVKKAEPKKAEPKKAEEPKPVEETVTVKKTRRPRTRKAVKE